MGALRLPRLSPSLPFTSDGKPANAAFRTYWQTVEQAIEAAYGQIQQQVVALNAASAAAQQATTAANQAAAAANNAAAAADPSAPQTQFAYATLTPVFSIWTRGPVINFGSAVAATPSFTGSGPTDVSQGHGPDGYAYPSGDLRLIQIIGGTETILDTQSFTSDGTGTISWPGFTYSGPAPDSLTGAISYAIDVEKTDGAGMVTLYLECTRTP